MKIKLNLLIFSATISFLFLTSCNTTRNIQNSSFPSCSEVKKGIKLSAHYLRKHTKKNGMFVYRVNIDPTVKIKKSYNILRHAGTIYAMGEYDEWRSQEKMKIAIKRAGNYLKKNTIHPIFGRENLLRNILAVWSKPEINKRNKLLQAKLGGTGLGLVALLEIERIEPGFTKIETLRSLGKFLIFMQKEDGSFYSKYIPAEGGFEKKWQSLYYPGEAALGLLMLYEKDPSEIWLNSAYKALRYLALQRKAKDYAPVDHWALLATEKLLSLKTPKKFISKKLLINHAIQISETILNHQVKNAKNQNDYGSFFNEGEIATTATCLEGLLATLSFLPPDYRKLRKKIKIAVSAGTSFLLQAQVKKGQFAGGFPRRISKIDSNHQIFKKDNSRATEIRIDYVQHALNAMLKYLESNLSCN